MSEGRAPSNRELTEDERCLIEWLIAHGTRDATSYLPQLDSVRVVSHCTCGCPTIDLAPERQREATVGPSTIVGDATGRSPEGVPVGIILHAREGQLSELEIYSQDTSKNFGLPDLETLEAY